MIPIPSAERFLSRCGTSEIDPAFHLDGTMDPLLWFALGLAVLWVIVWLVFEAVGLFGYLLLLMAAAFLVWGLARRAARRRPR